MTVRIDIAICTFRRPHLADTLQSLARLELAPGWDVRIIVADNDETPSARGICDSAAIPFPVNYIHAPAFNISTARNACIDASNGDYLAFIDDDEFASPGWMTALTDSAAGADVVLGPVHARYSPSCPLWIRAGDYHSSIPVAQNGRLISGGTGNVLLRRAFIGPVRFRTALGRSGGEDTAFFSDLEKRGARFAIRPDAIVYESVPEARESLHWLLRRRFRYGETHGLLLRETARGMAGRLRHALPAAAKTGFCAVMAAVHLPVRDRARRWTLRGALHAGVVTHLLRRQKEASHG